MCLAGLTLHALVWVPSFRAYFRCIQNFQCYGCDDFAPRWENFQCVRLLLCCSFEYLSVVGGKKFLVKHVADKFYPKNFSFGPEKDFFIQSPTSLANDFQAVFGPDMPKAQTS